MILDEMHFEYGSFISREYGIVFAHMDTSNFYGLSGSVKTNTIFNRRDNTLYSIGNNWDDSPITMDVEILTYPIRALLPQERRVIEKALFNKQDYRKLYVDSSDDLAGETYEVVDGEEKRFYFQCKFLNPEKIEITGGLVVGYKCTMECDNALLTQESITKTYNIDSSSDSITVTVDTDSNEYVYPKVTVNMGSTGGDVTIVNFTDDETRLTQFVDLSPEVKLIMDGRINSVSGQNYSKFRNQNFVRLRDGVNSITVTGDVESISFEWNNHRYI